MHSRKTAGSSITCALNMYLGDDDIQIGAWNDAIRSGGKYNKWALSVALKTPLAFGLNTLKHSLKKKRPLISEDFINATIRDFYRSRHGLAGGAHASAMQVMNFDPDSWNAYFKFCIVRNPWTHAVSDYHWRSHILEKRRGIENSVSFKKFLERLEDASRLDPERIRPPIITNWSIYTVDDKVALDYIGKYENLEKDLTRIGKEIGIPLSIKNVAAKATVKPKEVSIREYYDDENVELVRKIYAKEIDCFSYSPPF